MQNFNTTKLVVRCNDVGLHYIHKARIALVEG